MSQILTVLYIDILVDWSLSGIMTSKLVIRESESPRPVASSILSSRMTSSSVIIPYIMTEELVIHEIRIDKAAGRGDSDSRMMDFEVIIPLKLQSTKY